MSASTVAAPRTCASISAELSTAVTRWPSATSSCVIRPAPQPSSRISLPEGTAPSISSGLAQRRERGVEPDWAAVASGRAHARTLSRYRPAVAVATNEYGLFINGETVEGSVLPRPDRAGFRRGARHGAARGRGRDRPRGRGRTRRARRRLGQDARERALAAAARARRRAQGEPERALGARGPQRRQGDLVDEGRALRRGRELPLLRLRDRLDRRPLEPDRRLAPLLHAEGAGRRRGADRSRGTTRC